LYDVGGSATLVFFSEANCTGNVVYKGVQLNKPCFWVGENRGLRVSCSAYFTQPQNSSATTVPPSFQSSTAPAANQTTITPKLQRSSAPSINNVHFVVFMGINNNHLYMHSYFNTFP
jgi:hypothetical protein